MTNNRYRLLAQTSLRNILGTKNLHEILSDRDSISMAMQVDTIFAIITIHFCSNQYYRDYCTIFVIKTILFHSHQYYKDDFIIL